MSEAKHTPGPWRREQDIILAGEIGVAEIFQIDEPSRPTDERPTRADCEAEEQANAHLVAAAPDLLKALRRAVGAMIGLEHLPSIEGALREARAAIARSAGKETP
jgi:hypothetical protein